MKIEFSSQRREMLLLLTTNNAAVTSRANQQQGANKLSSYGNESRELNRTQSKNMLVQRVN